MPRPKVFGMKEPGRVAREMERKFGIPDPNRVPPPAPQKNGKKKAKKKAKRKAAPE